MKSIQEIAESIGSRFALAGQYDYTQAFKEFLKRVVIEGIMEFQKLPFGGKIRRPPHIHDKPSSSGDNAERCPECKHYYGHNVYCSLMPVEQRAELAIDYYQAWLKDAVTHTESRQRMRKEMELLQGRCAVLKTENNSLRKKIARTRNFQYEDEFHPIMSAAKSYERLTKEEILTMLRYYEDTVTDCEGHPDSTTVEISARQLILLLSLQIS